TETWVIRGIETALALWESQSLGTRAADSNVDSNRSIRRRLNASTNAPPTSRIQRGWRPPVTLLIPWSRAARLVTRTRQVAPRRYSSGVQQPRQPNQPRRHHPEPFDLASNRIEAHCA